jgi:hypothetical protein
MNNNNKNYVFFVHFILTKTMCILHTFNSKKTYLTLEKHFELHKSYDMMRMMMMMLI